MKKYLILPFLLLFFCFGCNDDYSDSDYAEQPVYSDYEDISNDETYEDYGENPFIDPANEPISTFSIDADGGSYTNVRRMINNGQNPPKEAIRVEEFLNYFNYDFSNPTGNVPISVRAEVGECAWNSEHRIIQIGIKGKIVPLQDMPTVNYVFLIDVSGSMSSPDKLELVKSALYKITDQLRSQDKVAIVTYAGNSRVVLQATSDKEGIRNAVDGLGAGGGTAGSEGIKTAYEIAEQNFVEDGNNRIILATDGDFNVGITNPSELITLIEEKRESGVFTSVFGVGIGNYNDVIAEQIANNGNGNYFYLDSEEEVTRLITHEYGIFYTVASDVKVQVEFDPNTVSSYRLIGYENRLLNNEDFDDDKKDAGEIGAGQSITALYEIVPKQSQAFNRSDEYFEMNFRYKENLNSASQLITINAIDEGKGWSQMSNDFRFASSVASFAMILRESEYKGTTSYQKVIEWAEASKGTDEHNYRKKFIELVKKAK